MTPSANATSSNPLRRLYDWTLLQAEKPYAMWMLAALSFAEASFFPIPPEVVMIPMILATPHRWWKIALVAIIASVLGGAFGYLIGYALFELIGDPVLNFYHAQELFADYRQRYDEWGWLIVLAGGFTPIPYKVITIASGAAKMNVAVFMLASLVSRGARMLLVAALLRAFGPWIKDKIDRWFGPLSILGIILIAAGFYVLKIL